MKSGPWARPQRTRHRRLSVTSVMTVAVLVALAVVTATVIVAIMGYGRDAAGGPPTGLKSFDVGPPSRHTDKPVSYEQTPPVGGKHDPVWQNCGFYSKPVQNENAVHSLEHGAVWLTYRPDLSKNQVDSLRTLLSGQTYLLASPHENLPAPVVASAWGKQVELKGANDPNLRRFIQVYRQGPQTPEPGAVCTGGEGTPE